MYSSANQEPNFQELSEQELDQVSGGANGISAGTFGYAQAVSGAQEQAQAKTSSIIYLTNTKLANFGFATSWAVAVTPPSFGGAQG